ncbi:unnamed protein product [Meloidogyne enterolobii]|uniref:Uncharacterized protein n=1 Tax=Meloidogyne enterolobii TaxID=390850 RepID=A0ACB0ZWQ4_MELEN
MIKQINIMGEINWQLKMEVGELENKNLVLEEQAKKANENNEELNKTINKLLGELEKSKKEKDLNFVKLLNGWKLVENINPCCNKKCEKKYSGRCIQGNGCIRVKLNGKLKYNKRIDDKGREIYKGKLLKKDLKNIKVNLAIQVVLGNPFRLDISKLLSIFSKLFCQI